MRRLFLMIMCFSICPPFLGAITINALSAADLLIIPTQAEYFSAYALRNMMSMIRRVRQESNPDLGYRILITLLDRRNRTHRNIQEQLQNTFGEGLFKTVIEVDTKLRESPIAGVPITLYRSAARGSQQYRELAQELTEYVKEKIPTAGLDRYSTILRRKKRSLPNEPASVPRRPPCRPKFTFRLAFEAGHIPKRRAASGRANCSHHRFSSLW